MSDDDKFVRHEPCPECGSKDNLCRYESGSASCRGIDCKYYEHGTALTKPVYKAKKKQNIDTGWEEGYVGEYVDLKDRGISKDTMRKYGVKVEDDKQHYPYYNKEGDMVGFKTRAVSTKRFWGNGDTTSNNKLFGQQLFNRGGKFVTVVEGELDALAAYEMLGSTWAVVSVANGTDSVDNIKANLEWLDAYENVVLCFDSDEAGRKGASKIAPLLGPNKCKIVTLEEYKDACDYLKNRKADKFKNEWWNARAFVVSGIATLDEMEAALREYKTTEIIPLPDAFGNLNEILKGGFARGELVSIISHTSIGKTTIINELMYHFTMNTKEKMGCFMVEDNLDEVVRKLVSVHKGVNLSHENPQDLDVDDIMKGAREVGLGDRIQIHNDGGGSINIDEMFSKMRYFIKGMGCTVILIDPFHTAIKNLSNENIEDVIDRLIKLCKETRATIILSAHTRKPADPDKPHRISEYDAKGSGAIPQGCHINILLSRDKLADTIEEKNSTRIRVAKSRRASTTGEAGWTMFNPDTARLEKVDSPMKQEVNGDF